MSARDLAIGLLFGDGGNRSDIFHYILDNSVDWHDIPIGNSNFKFAVSIIADEEQFEFFNSGWLNHVTRTDFDDAKIDVFNWRRNTYVFCTAFENNVPLYSTIYPTAGAPIGSSYSNNMDYIMPNNQGIDRWYWYYDVVYEYIPNSLAFNAGNFAYSFDSRQGYFNHYITVPNATFVMHKKYYDQDWHDMSVPKIMLTSETDETETIKSSELQISTIPMFFGTFSDMTFSEIRAKYDEIVQAVYEAEGYVYRNREEVWIYPPEPEP